MRLLSCCSFSTFQPDTDSYTLYIFTTHDIEICSASRVSNCETHASARTDLAKLCEKFKVSKVGTSDDLKVRLVSSWLKSASEAQIEASDASSFETPVQPEPPKSPPPPKCPLPPEVTPPMPPPDSPPPEIEDEPAFLPHMPSEKAPLSEESSFEEITAAFPQLKCAKKTASFQVGGMPVMKVAVSKAFPTLLQAAQEADLRRCALKKKMTALAPITRTVIYSDV